jgi:DNA (cytosine-5)-methyltransferase 1
MELNHLGLFEGIGGFSLAAQWMGWETKAWCEINPFCQTVLKHHFPKAECFEDIKLANFEKFKGEIDIITGGFPCQPYSSAGKRLGKEDERHLWPDMLRAIREFSHVGLWAKTFSALLIGREDWYSTKCKLIWKLRGTKYSRMYFQLHPSMLPTDGIGFGLLPTSHNARTKYRSGINGNGQEQREFGRIHSKEFSTDTKCSGGREMGSNIQRGESNGNGINTTYEQNNWSSFPTQPPICGGDDGIPTEMDGITFSKWRSESIKAYGNAIVPQVALQIFKAIEQYETKGLSGIGH